MKKNRIIFAIAMLVMISVACAKVQRYPEPPAYQELPNGEFPIIASYAFYQPYINGQQFEWLKEAGFNVIRQNLSPADLDSCLRLAKEYGVYVIAKPYGITADDRRPGLVKKYKDNPNVWGFCLFDEPNAALFDSVAHLRRSLNELAPLQNGFINLLPAVSAKQLGSANYSKYVNDYVKKANPAFLSLDIYPVYKTGKGDIDVTPCLYETMEVIKKVSQESKRPFWSYILSSEHRQYPTPTRESIRFSVFSALGYGAQGLIYYTYLMPDFDKGKDEYKIAPIDWEGNRTSVWYRVRDINQEVRNLEKVFLGSQVLSVTQTGIRIPKGTERLKTLPSPFKSIDSDGEGLMVSHLRNGTREYLLLINRDINNAQKVRLERSRPVTRLYGDGSRKQEKESIFELGPGAYALYEITEAASR